MSFSSGSESRDIIRGGVCERPTVWTDSELSDICMQSRPGSQVISHMDSLAGAFTTVTSGRNTGGSDMYSFIWVYINETIKYFVNHDKIVVYSAEF